MGFRELFGTDSNSERHGIELDYGNGLVLTVARAGGANVHFQKTFTAVTAAYKRAIEAETISKDKAEDLMREVYARSVLLKWEGVTKNDLDGSGDTTPVDCNTENKIAFFKALPDVFLDVQAQATKSALFRKNLEEAELGN